jgi:hypothetical protein
MMGEPLPYENESDEMVFDEEAQNFANPVPSPVREMSLNQFAFTPERFGRTAMSNF